MKIPSEPLANDAEIDLLDLIAAIRARKWTVAAVTAAAVLLAIIYLHTATYKYTATLKLTPTQEDQSLSGSLGNLASLAGVSLPKSAPVSHFALYLEGVHSRQVAEKLTENPTIMRTLFASQWHDQTGQWEEPASMLRPLKNAIKSVLGFPIFNWQAPSAADVEQYLKQNVVVIEDQEKSIATITFDHPDPVFAVMFLTHVHDAADQILRQRTLVRSTQYIDYLQKKLSTVMVTEHRAALAQALSEQEKLRMMASSSVPFAAEPFGPVTASSRPTTPQPAFVLVLALLVGGLLGAGAVFVRLFVDNAKNVRGTSTHGEASVKEQSC